MRAMNFCAYCRYFSKDLICNAFPFGIPETILQQEIEHFEPVDGDSGITFYARDDAPKWVLEARSQAKSKM